jgi:N-acylneuraminate cytidylyltransferase
MKDKVLAIIPARGGSKRIPRKNIKNFLGKPIITYSIERAINSKLFDEVMVSTDDEEIAEVAKKYGAEVPFMRSKKNSDDYAGTADVIEEVLKDYSKEGEEFKIFCCIYPTAPLISEENLKKGLELLKSGKFNSVFPVVGFSYPIQRALRLDQNYKTEMIWPENQKERSQDLEEACHDAGQFYWGISEKFLKDKKLFSKNSGAIMLKETEVQDIDSSEDWKMAGIKYQILNN